MKLGAMAAQWQVQLMTLYSMLCLLGAALLYKQHAGH